jgi:hypothetical protein
MPATFWRRREPEADTPDAEVSAWLDEVIVNTKVTDLIDLTRAEKDQTVRDIKLRIRRRR